MKVRVKVRCQFVTTRQIESRLDFQIVRSCETYKIIGGMHMKVQVKVRCQFVTTRTGGDDRTNRKWTGLSDCQLV